VRIGAVGGAVCVGLKKPSICRRTHASIAHIAGGSIGLAGVPGAAEPRKSSTLVSTVTVSSGGVGDVAGDGGRGVAVITGVALVDVETPTKELGVGVEYFMSELGVGVSSVTTARGVVDSAPAVASVGLWSPPDADGCWADGTANTDGEWEPTFVGKPSRRASTGTVNASLLATSLESMPISGAEPSS
jgi:hypothetical protein